MNYDGYSNVLYDSNHSLLQSHSSATRSCTPEPYHISNSYQDYNQTQDSGYMISRQDIVPSPYSFDTSFRIETDLQPKTRPSFVTTSYYSDKNGRSPYPLKRRGGNNDLRNAHFDRFNLAKLKNTNEKLDFLIELEKQIPDNLGSLTENARNFVNLCLPIIHCFHRHHQSNKLLFEQTYYMGFSYTTFKKAHCNVLKRGYNQAECSAIVKKRIELQNIMESG